MEILPNQRKFTRVPIGYRVKVMSEEITISCASAINISINGILVEASEPLLRGTSCSVIIFVLEEGLEIKIMALGTVVRNNANGLAIRFSKILGKDGREQLQNLIMFRCNDPEQAKQEFEDFVRQTA